MSTAPKIDVAKLKRDVIEATSNGKMSRRALSLKASDGKNPDLVRDLISRGQDRQPTLALVAGLAAALGKDASDYIGGAPAAGKELIWVIGEVQAGAWREQAEWREDDRYRIEVEPSPFPGAERFALEMVGHSMDRIIPPGSVLECLRVFGSDGLKPRNGDVVIVERQRNDLFETTCKRLEIRADGEYVLHCESYRPEFAEPVFIGKPDDESFSDDGVRIIAIVDRATQRFFGRRQ